MINHLRFGVSGGRCSLCSGRRSHVHYRRIYAESETVRLLLELKEGHSTDGDDLRWCKNLAPLCCRTIGPRLELLITVMPRIVQLGPAAPYRPIWRLGSLPNASER